MRPSVRYTHSFVRDSLTDGATRIFEIGCGSGELAALLIADGLQVTAIDADPDSVAAARRLGVDATTMSWPARVDEQFDAVLFTRSLHHVDDLLGSIAAALAVLSSGGRIIVEDFRAEGGSKRSARWFEALARDLHGSGALSDKATVAALLDKASPSSSHDHHLHSSADIRRALEKLNALRQGDSAYYFRYLEPHLHSDDAAEQLLQLELDLIANNSIDALGTRFVAGNC